MFMFFMFMFMLMLIYMTALYQALAKTVGPQKFDFSLFHTVNITQIYSSIRILSIFLII